MIFTREKRLLTEQIILFFVSDLGIALSKFVDYKSGFASIIGSIAIGLMFWVCLVGGIIIGRVLLKILHIESIKSLSEVLSFFQNKIAIIFDALFFISLAAFVVVMIVNKISDMGYLLFGILMFSFEMHCVFNGRAYKYITSGSEERKNENA